MSRRSRIRLLCSPHEMSPTVWAMAEDGAVFVAVNNCIHRIFQGEVSPVAGTGSREFKDGAPSEACFYYPCGLALDGSGSIIVADNGNHRIRQVTPQGVATLAGNGQQGNQDGPAQEASFAFPLAVAVGPNGHVMATDLNGRLCLISDGNVSTVATGLNGASGLLVDCRGNAIVADTKSHRIVFCPPQGVMTVIVGNGEADFKDGPTEAALFNEPRGLALDHEGRVVVADRGNHRVRALTLPSTKRLQHELASFTSVSPHLSQAAFILPPGCNVTRSPKSLFKWFALLQVAEGPFRGGLFELCVEMAFDYPASAPLVKFVIPITHPNVDPRTGEVSVPWNPATSNIGSALKDVQVLLEYPFDIQQQHQVNFSGAVVRNLGALHTWQDDRLVFDDRAYEEVRQSWLNKLKPSDTSELLCGMLCPAKKLSRESQNKQFEAVAVQEIETFVQTEPAALAFAHEKTASANQADQKNEARNAAAAVVIHAPTLDRSAEQNRSLKEKHRLQTIQAMQANLKTKLTDTLIGLADLRNPRLEFIQWLEAELARLRVGEAKENQEKHEEVKKVAINSVSMVVSSVSLGPMMLVPAAAAAVGLGVALFKKRIQTQDEVPLSVQRLMDAEGKHRPETSQTCFAMLVAEADREAKRLGYMMELCATKYDFLYARFGRVLQIQDYIAPRPSSKQRKISQPLNGSASVLIAQAKLLESELRAEFERLVRAVNEGEEKSPLRLSNGLFAQAKFGPGKSLSRTKTKQKEVHGLANSVLDYCRLTVVFADPLLLARFHDELRQCSQQNSVPNPDDELKQQSPDLPPPVGSAPARQQSKLRVVRVVNKFNLPRPWEQPPNVHINFEFEGHVCEVQLILEDFLLIKEYSHKPYELVRLVPRDPKTNKVNVELMKPSKLKKAIEFVIAEGVYCKHPGPASFPSSASFFSFIKDEDSNDPPRDR